MSLSKFKTGEMVKTALFSWGTFIGGTVASTGIYYAIVLGTCYRREIRQLFLRKKNDAPTAQHEMPVAVQVPKNQPGKLGRSADEGLSPVVHELIAQLNAYIEQSVEERKPREVMLEAIGRILAKYPSLVGSPFQQAIINLIVGELDIRANIQLTDEEQNNLWL